jgi:hypothetical protein
MSESDKLEAEIEMDIEGKNVRLPLRAFEEGARVLNLSGDFYVGTVWYRDSIQAFFSALKRDGFSTIQL